MAAASAGAATYAAAAVLSSVALIMLPVGAFHHRPGVAARQLVCVCSLLCCPHLRRLAILFSRSPRSAPPLSTLPTPSMKPPTSRGVRFAPTPSEQHLLRLVETTRTLVLALLLWPVLLPARLWLRAEHSLAPLLGLLWALVLVGRSASAPFEQPWTA